MFLYSLHALRHSTICLLYHDEMGRIWMNLTPATGCIRQFPRKCKFFNWIIFAK
jgi:hypothetical protein